MTSRRDQNAARGLTLIEVIVTISVTSLLMAIALPGFRSVQESSRATQCSSNLRQLGVAALTYASHNGEHMPAAILFKMSTGGLRTITWDTEQRADGSVVPGPIGLYVDSVGALMQCPSFQGASAFGNDVFAGYNYNTTYIGAEGRFPELGPDGQWIDGWSVARRGLPPSAHQRPDRTALFADAAWKGGANKFMRAPSALVEGDLATVYAGGQAFRHRGCAHVVFLDGHTGATARCCEGDHATPQLLDDVMGFPDNGFLSEDDRWYDPR
ncbi:MAG: type II secretion system protein [Phycisphaerae bacterium]|nr:type II secretion system protein [Phycisphaerae bacterium]